MIMNQANSRLMTRSEVSYRLRLSPERIRQLAIAGMLSYQDTPLGRLFDAGSVEAYAVERERRRTEASDA
jgi:hypothetical protein